MGRGRQKAKHTKVARELKYSTHNTDFEALQRELSGQSDDRHSSRDEDESDEYDPYAEVDER
ncbi:MAG: DUF3073 domain-containing protein [Sciscionella sp.]|nr:DUF3073 domain-containing protein [Sciscionella sp.]